MILDLLLIAGGICLICYLLMIIFEYRTRRQQPKNFTEPESKTYNLTLAQLSLYDGIQKPQTFISIKNTILDVTGSEFYGPDGSYRMFVGKDVSVALAMMSFSPEYFNSYNKFELNSKQTETLNDWFNKLSYKYKIMGKVIQDKKMQ